MKKSIVHSYAQYLYYLDIHELLMGYLPAKVVPEPDLDTDYESIALNLAEVYCLDELTAELQEECTLYHRKVLQGYVFM